MLRKLSVWASLTASFLFTSAFTLQESTSAGLPTGWAALAVVFVIIFILAILLIFQGHKTPEAVARYHLDHGEHGHSLVHSTDRSVDTNMPVAGTVTASTDEQDTSSPEVESTEGAVPAEDQTRVDTTDVAEPTAQAVVEPDDLTRIEGIGPKINQLLNEAGIFTYAQLSTSDPTHLKDILVDAGPRFGLADPSSWPEQAGFLAAGDEAGFKTLAERLDGGLSG